MADTPAFIINPSTTLDIAELYVNPNQLSASTIGNTFVDPDMALGTTYIGGLGGVMTPGMVIPAVDMSTSSYYIGNYPGIFSPSSQLYIRGLNNFQVGDDAIELILGLVQDFDAIPQEGDAPLTVSFIDHSSPYVTAWLWEFGDGGTSTIQHPTNVYVHSGTYTVRQMIFIGTYQFSLEKKLYIIVHPMAGPSGDMTAVDRSLFPGICIVYRSYFLNKAGPFIQNELLDPTDLKLEIDRGYSVSRYPADGTYTYDNQRLSPIEISYAIKKLDSTADTTGHLVDYEYRTAVNSNVGRYYTSMFAPDQVGRYRIEWLLRRDNTHCPEKRIQEFDVNSWGIDATYIFPV
jgi:hypothetical protein